MIRRWTIRHSKPLLATVLFTGVSTAVLAQPVVDELRTIDLLFDEFNTPFTDGFTVTDDASIVSVSATPLIVHGGFPELELDLTHETTGTSVRLLDHPAGSGSLHAIFGDGGVPHGTEPFDCFCLMQPAGPGSLSDFVGLSTQGTWSLTVNDISPGVGGFFFNWQLTIWDTTPPVTGVTCIGDVTTAEVTWINPAAYDFIEVHVDGTLVETVGGGVTSYSHPVSDPPTDVEICLVGVSAGLAAPPVSCQTIVFGEVDAEGCSEPAELFGPLFAAPASSTDTVTVDTELDLESILVSVAVGLTVLEELTVSLESPGGTSVILHDGQGGTGDVLLATYASSGAPGGTVPYDCDCLLAPGPGSLDDFVGESTEGDWRLTVESSTAGGVFGEWCLRLAAGEADFVRGDANDDGSVDLADAIFLLASLFVAGAEEPACADAADANDDGLLDISDAIYTLGALFTPGAPSPPPPHPSCGGDPTIDALECAEHGCP